MKYGFYDFVIDDEEKIIEIKDNEKKSILLRRLSHIIWIAYGMVNLYSFIKTGNDSKLVGVCISVVWLIMFLLDMNKSFEPIIRFDAIDKVTYNSNSIQNRLILKLKNNKKRIIYNELSYEKLQIVKTIFTENSILFEDK